MVSFSFPPLGKNERVFLSSLLWEPVTLLQVNLRISPGPLECLTPELSALSPPQFIHLYFRFSYLGTCSCSSFYSWVSAPARSDSMYSPVCFSNVGSSCLPCPPLPHGSKKSCWFLVHSALYLLLGWVVTYKLLTSKTRIVLHFLIMKHKICISCTPLVLWQCKAPCTWIQDWSFGGIFFQSVKSSIWRSCKGCDGEENQMINGSIFNIPFAVFKNRCWMRWN